MVSMKICTEDATDQREAIFDAARHEFARYGFAGGRIGRIAKAAGVAKSLVFYHFKTKGNLYQQVLRDVVEHEGAEASLSLIQDTSFSPSVRLRWMIESMCEQLKMMDPLDKQIILWEMAEGRRNLRTLAQEMFVPRFEIIEGLVKEGVDKGEFETKDSLLFVWSLISFIVFYNMQKETYELTPFYNRLYGEREGEFFTQFALEHFFKALGVNSLPAIPAEFKEKILQYQKEPKQEEA